jgi:hypothetical protein
LKIRQTVQTITDLFSCYSAILFSCSSAILFSCYSAIFHHTKQIYFKEIPNFFQTSISIRHKFVDSPLVLSVVGNKHNYDVRVIPNPRTKFCESLSAKANGEYKQQLSRPVGDNMTVKLLLYKPRRHTG